MHKWPRFHRSTRPFEFDCCSIVEDNATTVIAVAAVDVVGLEFF